MKRTQLTDLLSNIRAAAVSFFSILMFVALGVGIFLGILWAGPALYQAMDIAFDRDTFHHFQLVYPYGFTEGGIQQISRTEGVEDAEGIYAAIVAGHYAEVAKGSLKVQSVPERIDMLEVEKGALPTKSNEVAILELFAEENDLAVGDTIALSALDESHEYLPGGTYAICGIVRSPEYTSRNSSTYGQSGTGSGKIDGVVYVRSDAFNAEAFFDGYPLVNVRAGNLAETNSFSERYTQVTSELDERLSVLSEELAHARVASLRKEAQEQIDEGQKEIDNGQAQLAEGKERLVEATQEIEEAKDKAKDGEEQLTQAQKQIAEGEDQLAEAKSELNDGKAQIEQGEEELAWGRSALAKKKEEAEAQLATARKELESARARLDAAKAQADSARKQLAEAQDQLAQVDAAKVDGKSHIAEARERYTALEQQLAAGEITQEEFDAALDEYGARLRTELGSAVSAWGEYSSEIPSIDHTNFELLLNTVEQNFDDVIEGITVPVGDENITVAQARTKVAQGESDLAAAEAKITSGEETYAAGQAEYEKAKAEAEKQIAAAEAKLKQGQQQLNEAQAQAAQGETEIAQGEQKLQAGKEELAQKQEELEQGKASIAEGETQLAEKRNEATEAEAKLTQAQADLAGAKEQLASMADLTPSVAPRSYNGGIIEAETLGGVTTNLSFSMAMLFVIVGLLVCYSAVSRIVHEQITQIGTKKALGLNEREITTSFLGYSGVAVLVGAILGVILGVIAVENIINKTLSEHFCLGVYGPYVGVVQALGVIALELVLILGATWAACRGVLKKQAVDLLRGEGPPIAKQRFFEDWGLWKKLPLFTQTLVNNCLNDKRRVFSTVVGVAGCTALIVTAITLNNNVLKSYRVQYSDVYHFDTIAYVDNNESETLAKEIAQYLHQSGAYAAAVHMQNFALYLDSGDMNRVRVVVPRDEDDLAVVYTRVPVFESSLETTLSGVWVSRAFAEHLGVRAGDEIVIDSGDGVQHQLPIAGFYNFRLAHFEMLMDTQTYEQEFGNAPSYNAVLFDASSTPGQEFAATVQEKADVTALVDDKTAQRRNFDSFASVSRTVVLIYLSLAAAMAVVVLLNLNTMFIEEKKRELIVLMINGFSAKDVKRYIYNDNIVLTVLGIVLGVVLGCAMGSFTVASIEPSAASFVKGIDWPAVGIGVVGSALLSVIMSVLALRRIPRFNLTDINRF